MKLECIDTSTIYNSPSTNKKKKINRVPQYPGEKVIELIPVVFPFLLSWKEPAGHDDYWSSWDGGEDGEINFKLEQVEKFCEIL